MTKGTVSKQTRNNWLIDAAVFIGAVVAAITGIYFLFLPSGGYQGGRNPMYGITILFSRHTWDDLHTWFGALMIAAVVVHFAIHWNWVKGMAKRMMKSVTGKGARMNRHGYLNVAVDAPWPSASCWLPSRGSTSCSCPAAGGPRTPSSSSAGRRGI